MRERSWIPPDGLERARPREVKLTRGGHAMLAVSLALWFGAFSAFVGLQAEAESQVEERRTFLDQSVVTGAEVTRLWRARGDGNPPWVAYRFEVNGTEHAGQARMRLREWRQLRAGDRLDVRYLPADPRVSRLPGRERAGMPAFVPYLVGAGLAVGAGVLLLPLRSQRRLLSEGRAAAGRVTRHGKGQHGTTRVEFEFKTLSGTRFAGKSEPSAKPPAVGSPICVLYEPDDPKHNAVYPLSLVTPRNKTSLRARRYGAAAASSVRSMSAGLT